MSEFTPPLTLFAYSRGIIGSRPIERACREQATFMALSADSAPHFTTIAGFVSSLGEDIARVFSQANSKGGQCRISMLERAASAAEKLHCPPFI